MGSDVGWGVTIVPDQLDFISFVQSGLIDQTNPSSAPTPTSLARGADRTMPHLRPAQEAGIQAFDGLGRGIGSFTIDPGASAGAVDRGKIEIQYESFYADPNTCGTCEAGVQTVDLPFQVTVVPLQSIPEPASWLLVAAGATWGTSRSRFGSLL